MGMTQEKATIFPALLHCHHDFTMQRNETIGPCDCIPEQCFHNIHFLMELQEDDIIDILVECDSNFVKHCAPRKDLTKRGMTEKQWLEYLLRFIPRKPQQFWRFSKEDVIATIYLLN
jgi:hypothetical protein